MTTAQAASTRYTAAEVADATGIPPEKQLQWIDRHTIIPSRLDKTPSGTGDPRLMAIPTVYQFAIIAALLPLGVAPKHAASAARKFTDEPSPGRAAGRLYQQDQTLLGLRTSCP